MADADVERVVRGIATALLRAGRDHPLAFEPDRRRTATSSGRAAVRGERPRVGTSAGDAAALWELDAGEMFPLGALLAHRGVTSRLPRAWRHVLPRLSGSDVRRAGRAVARRSATSARAGSPICSTCRASTLQAEYAASVTARRGMATPLATLLRTEPVTASPATPHRRRRWRRWRHAASARCPSSTRRAIRSASSRARTSSVASCCRSARSIRRSAT